MQQKEEAPIAATIKRIAHNIQGTADKMQEISERLNSAMLSVLPNFEKINRAFNFIIGLFEDLKPYFEAEIEPFQKEHPEIAEITADYFTPLFICLFCSTKEEIEEMIEEAEKEAELETEPDPYLKYFRYLAEAAGAAIEKYADMKQSGQIQAEIIKQLPILKSSLPKSHTMPINRLANELQHDDFINGGEVDLAVANKGKKNEITSYVLATYEQPDDITMTGKPYTEYDRQVQDAISSIWEYGDESHIITPEMVFRAMTHRTQTETPSPQQVGAVTKSIEKMRRIHIVVDATEEMRKRKATVESCKFDDYLLSLRAVEVRAGGKTVKAYKITDEPILLTYAKMTKQLVTVPAELLDIKKMDKRGNATSVSVNNSDARIAAKGYILRRIAIMKHDKTTKKPKQSNIILFESFFKETGIAQDKNSANIKNYVYQVLDYYTATGYIKGYTKRKKKGRGGGIDAVAIDL